MPNLTTGFPKKMTGDSEQDYKNIYGWAVSLIDELKMLLCNLDSGNVTEAGSVKAQNIDVSQTKIKDAQVQSLTADKLTAGTIDCGVINVDNIKAGNIRSGTLDTEFVTVGSSNSGSAMLMDGEKLQFTERVKRKDIVRIELGKTDTDEYIFTVQSRDGNQGIYMDESGEIYTSGQMVIRAADVVGYPDEPGIVFKNKNGRTVAGISVTQGGDIIFVPSGMIKAGAYNIATERDIANLQKQIDALK